MSNNLNELAMPEHTDYAMHWAIMQEFGLRERRYRLAKLGYVAVVAEATTAIKSFSLALGGMERVSHEVFDQEKEAEQVNPQHHRRLWRRR